MLWLRTIVLGGWLFNEVVHSLESAIHFVAWATLERRCYWNCPGAFSVFLSFLENLKFVWGVLNISVSASEFYSVSGFLTQPSFPLLVAVSGQWTSRGTVMPLISAMLHSWRSLQLRRMSPSDECATLSCRWANRVMLFVIWGKIHKFYVHSLPLKSA
jgi:hypothetical protein